MNIEREQLIDWGLLFLRVSFSCFMLVHGFQKLQGFSDMSSGFPDPLGIGNQLSLIMAILAEVGCSFLLILGIGSRLPVLPLAFTMVIALFMVHGSDPWKTKELAATYLVVYLFLIFSGPGNLTVQNFLRKRKLNQ